ncbi:MAG: ATP-binding protein [Thaumarchaeota archaeon]|nr:MAG: ATP-binding protein [Candidatus Wolframiiraptor sp.]RLG08634.1 MAG: ATP-binding protein [Nitrososphaerota archaeon]
MSNALEKLREQEARLRERMKKVKHKIAVISGKGGVGKSIITVNLAMALASKGYSVGILDADIHGPSIPKMLGLHGMRLQSGPPGVFPVKGPMDVKVVSMDFLLPSEESPVIWRGPLKMSVIRQFLSDVVWGSLDFLLIDLPPGTGDEPLSVMQLLPEMDGAVIVTIPSEVSQLVVKKAVVFARELKIPVLGIIENMSYFICPNCGAEINIFQSGGGEKIAKELSVPFLGKIPLDPKICESGDKGVPFIVKHPESKPAKIFEEIVNKIEKSLKEKT